MRQGEKGTEIFVLHSGEACVERDAREIARLGPGQAFGEMAALSDAPRSAAVTVSRDAVVSVLQASEFRAMLAAQPAIAVTLARTFAERLARGA